VGLNDLLFLGLGALALVSACAVIFTKHTVYAALFFVTTSCAWQAFTPAARAPDRRAAGDGLRRRGLVLFVFAIMNIGRK